MKYSGLITVLLCGAVIITGCAPGSDAPSVRTAFTGITTHAYFARRIAGDRFGVLSLISPGTDAHTFSPLPAQVAALSRAQLYFRAGVEFENGLLPDLTAAAPNLRVVDLRQGIALRRMDAEEQEHGGETHEGHTPYHAHGYDAADPHIWMAPQLARQQAARIRDAFKQADAGYAARYDSAFAVLAAELDSLDAQLQRDLAGCAGNELFVFHPAFGYFTDAYGLKQVAVETGGKEPNARALARLIDTIKAKRIRVLFVQPQYPRNSVNAIARQTGCAVVSISSMPADYIAEMRLLGVAVKEGLNNAE